MTVLDPDGKIALPEMKKITDFETASAPGLVRLTVRAQEARQLEDGTWEIVKVLTPELAREWRTHVGRAVKRAERAQVVRLEGELTEDVH